MAQRWARVVALPELATPPFKDAWGLRQDHQQLYYFDTPHAATCELRGRRSTEPLAQGGTNQ